MESILDLHQRRITTQFLLQLAVLLFGRIIPEGVRSYGEQHLTELPSTCTGNQVTDLLREIPHDPTKMSYEPRHILYLPVRVDVMDIIETQLAENDGKLVDFASGVTTVTLHFKCD